ncbi:hypothetical protein H8356DRAFT_954995 [Neocallimastix lanati (nom. inval.)]|nr:hypothetical protein H8356DRAFT_954995 [Neocallimastix sp. JGI-2020a]
MYSKLYFVMFLLGCTFYTIIATFGFMNLNHVNSTIKYIEELEDINFNLHKFLRYSRELAIRAMTLDSDAIEKEENNMDSILDLLQEKYIPIIKKYSSQGSSDFPVIYYDKDYFKGVIKSRFDHLNGFDLMKIVIVWGRELLNTPSEEWIRRVKDGENVLLDYRIR